MNNSKEVHKEYVTNKKEIAIKKIVLAKFLNIDYSDVQYVGVLNNEFVSKGKGGYDIFTFEQIEEAKETIKDLVNEDMREIGRKKDEISIDDINIAEHKAVDNIENTFEYNGVVYYIYKVFNKN